MIGKNPESGVNIYELCILNEVSTMAKIQSVSITLILILFTPYITIADDWTTKSNIDYDSYDELGNITGILHTSSIGYENDNTTTHSMELSTSTDSFDLNDGNSTTEKTNDDDTHKKECKCENEGISENVIESISERVNTVIQSNSVIECKAGLLLPVWQPVENVTNGDRFARGLVYFLVMCYLFLGVSIVSDRFMAAIEKITAIEKNVVVRKPDGTKTTIVVRVWNETVANLTLMALGTSAPEILLSIIEIFTMNFEAGELGPSTIVGSAAYNLFTIIAICIVVIPNGQVRRIKHLRVFFVTSTFSIFAYIWLYLILAYFSPGIVSVGEGVITFLFFPLIVWMAYIADRRMLLYKYLSKGYRMNDRGFMIQMETSPTHPKDRSNSVVLEDGTELLSNEYKDPDQIRNDYVCILQELRRQHPQYDRGTLELMAQEQLLESGPKSRAFYRIQATRRILGGGNVIRRIAERTTNEVKANLTHIEVIDDTFTPCISFDPNYYTVMENCGSVDIRVVRLGDFSSHVSVDYRTLDGSAESGADYIAQTGTITFTPGISEGFINIEIIDDDVFEEDEAFFIQLSNPTNGAILGESSLATIMILDDDYAGFFSFVEKDHELIETVGVYELKVVRTSGARGTIAIPYWTEDGTAKGGKAYESQTNQLIFENNETE